MPPELAERIEIYAEGTDANPLAVIDIGHPGTVDTPSPSFFAAGEALACAAKLLKDAGPEEQEQLVGLFASIADALKSAASIELVLDRRLP